VLVTRTVECTDDGAVVTLVIESARDEAVLVRVVDPLGTDGTPRTDGSSPTDADGLLIRRLLAPGERVTATYECAVDRAAETDAAPPRIEVIESVTGAAESATDAGELVAGAGESVTDAGESVAGAAAERVSAGPTDHASGREPPAGALRTDGGELDYEDDAPADPTAVPAVGVVITGDDHAAVVRTVSRARERGHQVYLTYVDEAGEVTADVGGAAGAVVVDPPRTGMTPVELRAELVERAQEEGHPGILVQPVGAPPIDFDRSLDALEKTGYAATTVPATLGQDPDTPHVIVAIPAFNAVGTIADVVDRASAYADLVLVVDDGSEDGTGEAAREAGATVVEHRRNRGYGGALKTAFREADRLGADHLVVLDADGQHDPTDVPRLVEAQKQSGAEIVVGSRYMPESRTELPMVRRIGLGVINGLTNLSLGRLRPSRFIRDTQSGFRAYDRDAIASLASDPDIGDRMGASTDIIYHAHRERYRVTEVGTTIRYDVEHSSTLNPFVHGYDLVRNIAHTLTVVHPFKTLGAAGSVLTSVGIGVALEGFALGIQQGQVPFVKTYAATLMALLGLVLVFLAVDYHTIQVHPYYRRRQE